MKIKPIEEVFKNILNSSAPQNKKRKLVVTEIGIINLETNILLFDALKPEKAIAVQLQPGEKNYKIKTYYDKSDEYYSEEIGLVTIDLITDKSKLEKVEHIEELKKIPLTSYIVGITNIHDKKELQNTYNKDFLQNIEKLSSEKEKTKEFRFEKNIMNYFYSPAILDYCRCYVGKNSKGEIISILIDLMVIYGQRSKRNK